MPAKPYHHGALETALVEAAMSVVRKSGVSNIAIRDLAREIGVSPSAAYRHFPSRDLLIVKVSQVARELLATDMIRARENVGKTVNVRARSIERFRAMGTAYVRFATKKPRLFEAAFVPTDSQPATEDDPSAWQVLIDAIAEMINARAISAARRDDAPLIAWSSVHGLATILTESSWPDGVVVSRHIDAVIDSVIRALN